MKLINAEFEESLDYRDVFIVPGFSDISTRKQVDISSDLDGIKISVPVISANMESVTGARMAVAMRRAGALGALHRFQSIDRAVEDLQQNQKWASHIPILVSVGVNGDAHERAEALYEEGGTHFIIDIAHGHSQHMKEMIGFLKTKLPGAYVIAGNVATTQAAYDLCMWGADAIKVGIGPGSVCTTKNVTGVTIPGLQSVIACVHGARSGALKRFEQKIKSDPVLRKSLGKRVISFNDQVTVLQQHCPRIPVIADGGLEEIGDICKALGAGADFVMSGRFFAACDEAPGGTVYRGSASQDVQEQYRNDKQMPTPEGKTAVLEATGPCKGVVEDIAGGLRSAFSYVGAHNLKEYHERCTFGTRRGRA